MQVVRAIALVFGALASCQLVVSGQVWLCPGEEAIMELGGAYYGEKTWEFSTDSLNWSPVSVQEGIPVVLTQEQSGWYRVRFHDAACDTSYVSESVRFDNSEPLQLDLVWPQGMVEMGVDLQVTVDRYEELIDVTYYLNGTPYPSASAIDVFANAMVVDQSLWATATDAHGCPLWSDTVHFSMGDTATLLPLGGPITTAVRGRVVDEGGLAVPGALVKAGYGGGSTTTDLNGYFSLPQVAAFEEMAYITVERTGYFKGSRTFAPSAGPSVIAIVLLKKQLVGTVPATTGGAVSFEGASITFDSGFVKDGVPYDGAVNVAVGRCVPDSADFFERMPGTLFGADGSDEGSAMLSYGMLAVELLAEDGLPVQMQAGNTAEVRLPVTPDQLATAPATIDTWSFNEDRGYWILEGTGTLQDTAYVFEADHFSWWNCDDTTTYVWLDGSILVERPGCGIPVPLAGVAVDLHFGGMNAPAGRYITATNGSYRGRVPRNEPFTLNYSYPCGGEWTLLHTEAFVPLNADTTLAPIQLFTSSTIVSGMVVNCDGQPVTDGYVTALNQVYQLNDQGEFIFPFCGNQLTMAAYDESATVNSYPIPFAVPPGCVDLGTVEACGMSLADSTVSDNEGHAYHLTIIGSQMWMTENLRTAHFNDGSAIPHAPVNVTWSAAGDANTPAWCHTENNAANDTIYGMQYNWHAVVDPRGVCPLGWRVGTDADWKKLEAGLGVPTSELDVFGYRGELQNVGGGMKEVSGLWEQPNTGATNASGFNGRPAGYRTFDGSVVGAGGQAPFWTSTVNFSTTAISRFLFSTSGAVNRSSTNRDNGNAVRCVRE